ncbi:hypothetical protein B447_20558 [Thauera sp. 27]|uniref:hypothetical protein n=1 Tax=Thauera sp. 27 TaxID=305700 RepID=UPI0002CE5C14|nr:hypothetical protein [Thauera sp. 27]ENO74990.1 hypothetical protein B447_20558 [Thauera sp. 27]
MKLASTDLHHPRARREALAIARLGPGPHLLALSQFAAVFDSLCDGVQFPNAPYLGASYGIESVFDEQHRAGAVTVFYRVFWGSEACGLVAALCQADFGRPVFMAMTGFGLPGAAGHGDKTRAVDAALRLARARSVDL